MNFKIWNKNKIIISQKFFEINLFLFQKNI